MVAGCPQCEKSAGIKSQINPNPYHLGDICLISTVITVVFFILSLFAVYFTEKTTPLSPLEYAPISIMLVSSMTTIISLISSWLIGEYFYVFECPLGEIHCHQEAPIEKKEKFFFWRHIRVSDTEEKKEEIEITTPIMRLAIGGLFKKSEVLYPYVHFGKGLWYIKRLKDGFVELRDDFRNNLIIRPVGFKDALFILDNYSINQCGFLSVLRGHEERRQEVQELHSALCDMKGFTTAICRLVFDLKESKEKMRSPVGQKAREVLEAALAKLPEREVEEQMAVAAKERAEKKAENDKPAAVAVL